MCLEHSWFQYTRISRQIGDKRTKYIATHGMPLPANIETLKPAFPADIGDHFNIQKERAPSDENSEQSQLVTPPSDPASLFYSHLRYPQISLLDFELDILSHL